MEKIATRQYVSTFAGGGIVSAGNKGATKKWVIDNFSNIEFTTILENNRLVKEYQIVKKNLKIISVAVNDFKVSVQQISSDLWRGDDMIYVESKPFFTVVITVGYVGDHMIYPTLSGLGDFVEFERIYESGENDTAVITYKNIYKDPSLPGTFEGWFNLANEMSPNYEEIYTTVILNLNF